MNIGVVLQETLDEYLITYEYLTDKIARLDQRIEELDSKDRYKKKVKKLSCLIGVKTHTALSVIFETGDFTRFAKAENSHVRKLLVESAQSYTRRYYWTQICSIKTKAEGK